MTELIGLLTLSVVIIVVAVFGGGIKGLGWEFPPLKSRKRQLSLLLLGGFVAVFAIVLLIRETLSAARVPGPTAAPVQTLDGSIRHGIRLGGLDLNTYCKEFGYFEAYPSSPGSVYDGWKCRGSLPGGADKDIRQAADTIDLKAACEWQYPDAAARGQLEARAERQGDPGSWRCDLVP